MLSRSTRFYNTKCWIVKKKQIHKMSVTEMKILRWINRNTYKDRIQNERIQLKIWVAPIDEKVRENCLKCLVICKVEQLIYSSEFIQVRGKKKKRYWKIKITLVAIKKTMSIQEVRETMILDGIKCQKRI